ncbi:D-tyrosyl-tRNA(Tyr) deacylase [bacterium BMS3Abin01]|nr:D-tyrosyl-tRNA(Tyr) deacylase [bacterium BMS3Abin01]
MKALVQRVGRARVTVGGETVGEIGAGMLVLLGVATEDGESDADYIAGKLARLRIFDDSRGRMNLDISRTGGGILLVSQFTLLAETRRGNRPGFTGAAEPRQAVALYELVAGSLRSDGVPVSTGEFGATMSVELVNEGPVTIMLDSRDRG